MLNKNPTKQPLIQTNTDLLSKTELEQLKSSFSDISFSKTSSSTHYFSQQQSTTDPQKWESKLSAAYSRIKNTFYDLNSRTFAKYAKYSTYLNIKKQLEVRPQLLKLNIFVSSLECLAILMGILIPCKWVNKTLVGMAVVTVQIYFVEKFMLNYYIEQIALYNNKMEPVQQQARNLIEYKYRIQTLKDNGSQKQSMEPYVQKLLQEVDRKNLEYMRFKKVEMLV